MHCIAVARGQTGDSLQQHPPEQPPTWPLWRYPGTGTASTLASLKIPRYWHSLPPGLSEDTQVLAQPPTWPLWRYPGTSTASQLASLKIPRHRTEPTPMVKLQPSSPLQKSKYWISQPSFRLPCDLFYKRNYFGLLILGPQGFNSWKREVEISFEDIHMKGGSLFKPNSVHPWPYCKKSPHVTRAEYFYKSDYFILAGLYSFGRWAPFSSSINIFVVAVLQVLNFSGNNLGRLSADFFLSARQGGEQPRPFPIKLISNKYSPEKNMFSKISNRFALTIISCRRYSLMPYSIVFYANCSIWSEAYHFAGYGSESSKQFGVFNISNYQYF